MMSASRVSASPRPDCFSTNINMPTFITTTISSSFFLSSTLHFSPIFSISPNSSFHQPPNKNALVLHRSGSNLVCFQQSGVTSFGENKDKSVHEGVITQSLSNGMYSVDLDGGSTVLGRISGKIRKRFIQILPGDRVQVEISRYDTSKGRIIYRITEDNTDKDDIPKKPGKPQRKRK